MVVVNFHTIVHLDFELEKVKGYLCVPIKLKFSYLIMFLSFCLSVFLFQALMALFVLASKDGWVDIMYNGIDAVDIDQQVC